MRWVLQPSHLGREEVGGSERRGRGWEVRRGLGTRSLASGMTYLQLAIVFCEDSWLMVVHTAHRTLDAPVG